MESVACSAIVEAHEDFPLIVRFLVETHIPRGEYGYLPATLGGPPHSLAFLLTRKCPTDNDWYKRVSNLSESFITAEQAQGLFVTLVNTRLLPTSVIQSLLVERAPKPSGRDVVFSLDQDERRRLDRQGFTPPPVNRKLDATLYFLAPEPTPRFLLALPFKEPA